MAETKGEPDWIDEREPLRVDRTVELDDEPGSEGPSSPPASFAVGATVGRFVVRRVIGEGGMGLVLEAYDADLDRTVAIKIVRDRSSGSIGGRRLLREAQAMARLAHPNVVAIHEVGTVDGQVFLVMELVSGKTLGEWLATPHGWREIVSVLQQAGEGLLAAHRAGLVHRDFKPSNVLVDPRGRVRVSDFGIAHLAAEVIADGAGRSALASEPARAGARIGTPGYMAPEQRRGDAVGARADQYAFGVTLAEALRGQPARAVPQRLRRAIARATSDDAAARFPSMAELLAELRQAAGNRRRRMLIALAAAGGLIAGGASAGLLLLRNAGSATDQCNAGVGLIDRVWTESARSELARAFTASGRPYGASSATAVGAILDDYAGAWRLGRRAACQADAEVRQRRLACLDRRLGSLRAQLAMWSGPDGGGEIVDGAVRGAAMLPTIEGCLNAAAAEADPALAPLLARVDEAEVSERVGRVEPLRAALPALLAEAEAAADPTALAHVLAIAGRLARDAGDSDQARALLARAAREAGRAGDDRLMADALLYAAAAAVDVHPGEALGIIDAAEAIAARAGLTDVEPRIALRRGEALARAGRGDESLVELDRAVELAERAAQSDPAPRRRLQLAMALGMLATAYMSVARNDEARALLERALQVQEALLGPDHPVVAGTLHDLASCESHLHRFDDAQAHLERAHASMVAVYGPDHASVGIVEFSIAALALDRGDLVAARAAFAEARVILERALPADHPTLGMLEGAAAAVEREAGRCAAAIPGFERAIGTFDRAGMAGLQVALPLTGLGVCLRDLGQVAEARAPLERALAALQAEALPASELIEVRATLADVLWKLGEHAAGLALARTAAQDAAGDDAGLAPLRDQLRRWLSEHGAPPR